MTPPQHICPKCKQPRAASDFINARGEATTNCAYCRSAYRDRLTHLHAKAKTAPKRGEEIDAASVATREGYKDHPLASLLALSHIAGAKRALAIRDGNSWRGKKAWRAYYEAKRELGAQLEPTLRHVQDAYVRVIEARWEALRAGNFRDLQDFDARFGGIMAKMREELDAERVKRDPNSSGVS